MKYGSRGRGGPGLPSNLYSFCTVRGLIHRLMDLLNLNVQVQFTPFGLGMGTLAVVSAWKDAWGEMALELGLGAFGQDT